MTQKRIRVSLVPLGDEQALMDRCLLAELNSPAFTLGELLDEHPALTLEPVPPQVLAMRVARLNITSLATPGADTALYWPHGMATTAVVATGNEISGTPMAPPPARSTAGIDADTELASGDYPTTIDEAAAVRITHDVEIDKSAAYLDAGLSVLVCCEKLIVEHLAKQITGRSGRTARVVEGSGGHHQQTLTALQDAVHDAKPETDVVVVPHLDLLAGDNHRTLNTEARELTGVLYERSDCVLLAFVDPSLVLPEVLANRFAVRIAADILPREVRLTDGSRTPIGSALVTKGEARLFDGFDPVALYKHIAGMNAVRLRHAMRFALHQHRASGATFADLIDELRTFKAATSESFELPDVAFSQIGGYTEVREELERTLALIRGVDGLPQHLHQELVPRGFIFHGPPGTGKTLFAKAVATALEATIMVVSGPEVTDKWLGESERKVREIFAEARRNAPAVVVFDEFDSIASRRTGREDSASRAGNAVVAQLLTEMDGFRSAVPVLIIGTTNRLDMIDDALLRPSRFRPIRLDLPDREARRAIAKVHADHFGVPVSDLLLDRIATATNLMNGDEIRSIFRDACADTVVGRPPRPADARHLGELVGQLRRTIQERDVARGRGSSFGADLGLVDRSHTFQSHDRPAGQPAMVTLVAHVPSGEEPALP